MHHIAVGSEILIDQSVPVPKLASETAQEDIQEKYGPICIVSRARYYFSALKCDKFFNCQNAYKEMLSSELVRN